MSGETENNGEGSGGAEVARPDWLPESAWNAEGKTYNPDALKTDYAELATLREGKTAAETRAASLPKTPADYKIELPDGFKVPDGKKFQPDDKDPMVAVARDIAKEYGLDQTQFRGMVGKYAQMVLDGEAAQAKADKDFLDNETKALGEKADARRTAIKTWMGGNLTQEQAAALEPLVDLKVGVEAFESIMAAITGTTTRGNSNNETNTEANAEHAELVGKKGGAMALMRLGNEKK